MGKIEDSDGYKEALRRIDEAKACDATRIELSGLLLHEIPPTIGSLVRLQSLQLFDNQLKSLPQTVGELQGLRVLRLRGNKFSEIPHVVGSLRSLQTLDLGGNRLVGVSKTIASLSLLEEFILSSNRIRSLPPELGALVGLKRLWLSHNKLSEVPREIGRLAKLERLSLDNNELRSLPDEIGSLSNLQTLDFSQNAINDVGLVVRLLRALHRLTGVAADDNPLSWPNQAPISNAVLGEGDPARLLSELERLREGGRKMAFARVVTTGVAGSGKTHLNRRIAVPDDAELDHVLGPQDDGEGTRTVGIRRREVTFRPPEYGVPELPSIRLILQDLGGDREQIKAHFHLVYLAGQAVFLLCVRMDDQIGGWPRYYLHLLADLARRAYCGRHRDLFYEHQLQDLGERNMIGPHDQITVIVVPTHADRVIDSESALTAIRELDTGWPLLRVVLAPPVNNLRRDDVKHVLTAVAAELQKLTQVVTTVPSYLPAILDEVERFFAKPAAGSGKRRRSSMRVDTLRDLCGGHEGADPSYVLRELLRLGMVMTPLDKTPLKEQDDRIERVGRLINPEFLNDEVYGLLMSTVEHPGFVSKKNFEDRLDRLVDGEDQSIIREILRQYLVVFEWHRGGFGLLVPDQLRMRRSGEFEPWPDAENQAAWQAEGFVPEHALFELMARHKDLLIPAQPPHRQRQTSPVFRDACCFGENDAKAQVYLDVLKRRLSMVGQGQGADSLVEKLFASVVYLTECSWTPVLRKRPGRPLSDNEESCLQAMYELKAFCFDSLRPASKIAKRAMSMESGTADHAKRPMAALKRRGLVESIEGKTGGYFLTDEGKKLAEKLANGN